MIKYILIPINVILLTCNNINIKAIESFTDTANYNITMLTISILALMFYIKIKVDIVLCLIGIFQSLSYICYFNAYKYIESQSQISNIIVFQKSNSLVITLFFDFYNKTSLSFIILLGNIYNIIGSYILYINNNNIPYTIITPDEENNLHEPIISSNSNLKKYKYILLSTLGLLLNSISAILIKISLMQNSIINVIFFKSFFSLLTLIIYHILNGTLFDFEFKNENTRLKERIEFGILNITLSILYNLNMYVTFYLYTKFDNIGYVKSFDTAAIIPEILILRYIIKLDKNYDNILYGLIVIFLGNFIISIKLFLDSWTRGGAIGLNITQ